MPQDAPENRSERATLAVTPHEKRAIRTVAAARDTDESNLLRSVLIVDVVEEYARIRAVVGDGAERISA